MLHVSEYKKLKAFFDECHKERITPYPFFTHARNTLHVYCVESASEFYNDLAN